MGIRTITILAAATALLATRGARAADPTTADCVSATEASFKSGNEHKLRAERSQLLTCASSSCPSDIRKECVRRVQELSQQIPTIIFGAKDASGADLSAVRVTMDGEVLAERLEGTALSIDPGEHMFTFETAGRPTVTKTLVIQQAQKDRREVVTFATPTVAPSPVLPSPTPAPPPTNILVPTTTTSPPTSTASGHGLGMQKILALVAGGVGVVGVGVGTAFGVVAMSKKNDAQNACPTGSCATQADANLWSDAGSAGNVSTAAFVLGGVALAGGVVLWFTAPSGRSAGSTQVGLGLRGLQVKGAW
jgi:hypothetical protein